VSEVHLCADIAGWEPALDDAPAFITRGHNRTTHTETPDAQDEEFYVAPAFDVNMHGRRCTGYEFSKGARIPAASTTRPKRSPSPIKTGCERFGNAMAGTESHA
jgi:hypothetical protein